MPLHDTLARFADIMHTYEVIQYEVVGLNSRLKLKVVFTNATELIARWDNAPHWMEIETYPHHKYLGEEGRVVASEATTLEEILAVIRPAI